MQKLFPKGEQRCCYQKKKESGEDTGLTITSEYTKKVNGQEKMKRGQLKGTKVQFGRRTKPQFLPDHQSDYSLIYYIYFKQLKEKFEYFLA